MLHRKEKDEIIRHKDDTWGIYIAHAASASLSMDLPTTADVGSTAPAKIVDVKSQDIQNLATFLDPKLIGILESEKDPTAALIDIVDTVDEKEAALKD